jgi:hypothetical protein
MRHGLATALVAVMATVVLAAAAGQVKVTPIVTEGRVLASFTAADAWSIEVRENLQFGQVVTFDYYVDLKRPSTLWLDRTVAGTNVKAEAKFDTLTGKYVVTRHRDGRIVRSEKRDQESDVREWLTVFERVELEPESPLKANTDYYIQVRLLKYPRRDVSLWSILPGGSEDSSGRSSPFPYIR